MDPTLKSRTIATLKDRIAGFSPQLRLAAKYITDNQANFGLEPIRTTATRAGVSTYTLVRLAEHLGFSSYDALREPFRHALTSAREFAPLPGWADTLAQYGEAGKVQAASALNSLALTERTLEAQSPEILANAAKMMLSADRVFLTAVRSSYAMAYYFHYVGRMALPSLELVPRHMGSAVDDLNNGGPGDVLMAITVTPFSRETIQACDFAQKKGMKLILVTDSELVSPDLDPAFTLVAPVAGSHHFASFTGMSALIELILAHLVHGGGQEAAARIKSYEGLRRQYNAYWSARTHR
ncbi:MAG: MurR/RpiR family transcriptional regulator [Rhodobacteraceae bacterium]|nr:MurR/RpiR family transcriptional regulator [Paracoccaceae bacterium]